MSTMEKQPVSNDIREIFREEFVSFNEYVGTLEHVTFETLNVQTLEKLSSDTYVLIDEFVKLSGRLAEVAKRMDESLAQIIAHERARLQVAMTSLSQFVTERNSRNCCQLAPTQGSAVSEVQLRPPSRKLRQECPVSSIDTSESKLTAIAWADKCGIRNELKDFAIEIAPVSTLGNHNLVHAEI